MQLKRIMARVTGVDLDVASTEQGYRFWHFGRFHRAVLRLPGRYSETMLCTVPHTGLAAKPINYRTHTYIERYEIVTVNCGFVINQRWLWRNSHSIVTARGSGNNVFT